jgi:glycosyltransferase involved in cell wall biosynthesis
MRRARDVSIGVSVHAEPARLRATLDALRAHTPAGARLVLLPDGADTETRAALAALDVPQLASTQPRGTSACFNRLASDGEAPVVVLLESGTLVGPGWLEHLLRGLEADPAHGLAGPSTNLSWNEQGAFPNAAGTLPGIAETAARAARELGACVRELVPLHSLADFCYVVRREVIDAIGAADEGYGTGPCWEMDYNIRAARAGWKGVWVGAAYVHRWPPTARRLRDEARLFEINRRRYQDRFCGYKLRGVRAGYEPHCKGEACAEFAPRALIALRPAPPSGPAPAPAHVPARAPAPAEPGPVVSAGGGRPAVTCIMPTCDRPRFVPQAIAYFLRQDFTDAELQILDDGRQSVASLVPAHPRIRYVRLDRRRSVGAKRNEACRQARGEFIAHWDDDDWYARSRLARQMAALAASGAEICGTADLLFYAPASDGAWRYRYGGGAGAYLAGTSLFYRRAVWERAPFADVQVAEDLLFVNAAAARGAPGAHPPLDLADLGLTVGLIHAGNTSPKRTEASFWTRHPRAAIEQLLGEDLLFYHEGARAPALVSCIMPTRDRRAFVAESLRRFAEQDYEPRELIVVDDGRDRVEDLVTAATAGGAQVRYLRLPRRTSIGAKRNAACAEARGAIIVHWDDDDWYGPGRLSLQAAPILAGRADMTGLENRFVLELPPGRFWTTRPELQRRMFEGDVPGGTLAFRRELFEAGLRYPDADLAEDAAFIRCARAAGKTLERITNHGVFVYVRHGGNTWRFQVGQFLDRAGWAPVAPPAGFSGDVLEAYRRIALERGSRVTS